MAFTQAHLDRLDQAIASGATEVRYPDGSAVKYRTQDEMLALRQRMATAIAGAAVVGNPRTSVATFE